MKSISVVQAKEGFAAGRAHIIDVRSPAEFTQEHILGAINIPLDVLDQFKKNFCDAKKDLYVVCRSGQRSQMACKKLTDFGIRTAYSITGGTVSWSKQGFSTRKGKAAWDIERQVRFTAGMLVLTGVVLYYTVSSWFILLSAFVGAGLVFAALSNSCLMGMLLLKLPFNKTKNFSRDAVVRKLV